MTEGCFNGLMRAKQILVVGMLGFASVSATDTARVDDRKMHRMTTEPLPPSTAKELGALASATAWINSPPLTAADLRGKVVLVDIWTYTCVNWLRTLPYVRAWATKYKDAGLVVIGVHSPEFPFERDVENVSRAVNSMNIAYPVAVDSEHAIWRAFDNDAWPALYFVDANGKVRGRHLGEGEYEESERFIQRLLSEAGARGVPRDLVSVVGRGAEVAADWATLRSPETYVRHREIERFASPGGAVLDERRAYAAPARLKLNEWALAGPWTLESGAASSNEASGRIVYRFHARDVNLVLGPAARGTSVRFRVLVDGRAPGAAHGSDVDEQGLGTVTDQRLYQLVRQPGSIADRQFEIEFLDPGVEAFVFTFG
jgi:thiol-disulfide isomerase/thioredoxin